MTADRAGAERAEATQSLGEASREAAEPKGTARARAEREKAHVRYDREVEHATTADQHAAQLRAQTEK